MSFFRCPDPPQQGPASPVKPCQIWAHPWPKQWHNQKKKNFKYSSAFLECSGQPNTTIQNNTNSKTLQSRTIQTQNSSTNFSYFFFKTLSLSQPQSRNSMARLSCFATRRSPLFFLFATCNSSFPTVQNRNSIARLFFLFTPWLAFLSLLFQALCRLTPINCDRCLPLPSTAIQTQYSSTIHSLTLSLSQTIQPI